MRTKLLLGAAALCLAFAAPAAAPLMQPDPAIALFTNAADCTPPSAFRSRLGYFLAMSQAYAQTAQIAGTPPPIMRGLGAAHFAITTANPTAQAYFDQGLRLLHNFNHLEAARAFRAAQGHDANCAMCYWGEAFALGPNINAPMDPADHPAAVAAARAALARMDGASEKEPALIEALQVRYVRRAPPARTGLDGAFADAMTEVANRYADDDVIQTLAVEAMMDTQPWDYWQPGGVEPKGRAGEMVQRLETVMARSPNDAGAIHLYIHVVEASANPWRAEAAAERLGRLAPAAGHLVHMPGHIYYRVGRMRDSIDANIIAARADETYLAAYQASPTYQYGYYTHNVHFVMASAQMAGDGRTALQWADRLETALPMEMARQVVLAQPVIASVWYTRGTFEEPRRMLARPAPEGVDFVTGAWRYGRGLAQIRAGNAAGAREEAEELADLSLQGDFAMMRAQGVPGPEILEVYRHVLLGKAALLERDTATAIRELEAAITGAEAVPYTEPPYIYYPIRRTLGAAYLMAGQPALAEVQFLQTLTESPNDAYAYWGLAEARRMRGDSRGRSAARTLFSSAFLGNEAAVTAMSL